ncbi:MAG: chemotaxis protein CheA [Burkholderiaceae bacterium]|nr:MAG: chemotaxis protein CheA [Burkholderiaceae bacterium]
MSGNKKTSVKAAAGYVGKYREILLAVAFFLVFDLAVLVLNFYISFQISEDANAINLAGRQRMLSQRMAKAAYAIDADFSAGVSTGESVEELKKTVSLFDQTLQAFVQGGEVTGAGGNPVVLQAVEAAGGRKIMDQAVPLWAVYREALLPLQREQLSAAEIATAVAVARANNVKLLGLMNDLTNHLERVAAAKADRLRLVQTAGILLALVNFAFILFKFIRKLRENDRAIEAAQNETAEILGTVREGLFLLDARYKIGSQYSASLSPILGQPIVAGENFLDVLKKMVPTTVYETARDYIELLLGDRVKESLVQELNPLIAVEVLVSLDPVHPASRFLTFQFNRVMQGGVVRHLLVTVSDVTAQVELESKLAQARQKARTEVAVMLDVLKVSPEVLRRFLTDTEKALLEINDQLRSVGSGRPDYHRLIDNVFRKIHTIKGDAATLGLEMFEELAHEFESLLRPLRDNKLNGGQVSGEDLLRVPMPLDEMLERVTMVRDMLARLSSYQQGSDAVGNAREFTEQLHALTQRIATDHGKQVTLQADLDLLDALPQAMRQEVKDIVVQLLRNAVVHGIEPGMQRRALSKNETGAIALHLRNQDDGELELVLRDDGRGISPYQVRTALIASGRYTEKQLNELDDRSLLLKIFEPGFSTAAGLSRHAGQGVGMDVVHQKILQLGARLRVATRPNSYTQFSIVFSA